MKFFAGFGSKEIQNIIAINEYMSFVIGLILASGIVFELPMLSFFLGRIGILTPAFMRHYRKHAIVVILIIAAVLTPGPDIASQATLAIPLYLLYELSIFVVQLTGKKPKFLSLYNTTSSSVVLAAPSSQHAEIKEAVLSEIILKYTSSSMSFDLEV